MSQCMRFPTIWYVRPAKPQIGLRMRAVWSEPLLVTEYSMNIKLLTEYDLEFLSLTRGCKGLPESTHVKMPHCWKSHVTAHMLSSLLLYSGYILRLLRKWNHTLIVSNIYSLWLLLLYSSPSIWLATVQYTLSNMLFFCIWNQQRTDLVLDSLSY